MRIARTLPNPDDPRSIVEYLARVQRIIDGGIELGNPQDPRDPASTTTADGVSHNGTIVNGLLSWFEVRLDDATNLLNTNVTCIHNLDVSVLAADQPNVRWFVAGLQHDGTGTGAGSTVTVIYVDGSVTSNSIQLRFHAAARTVTVASPLKVSLLFIPAVHGIAQS